MIFKLSEKQYFLLRDIDFSEIHEGIQFFDEKRTVIVADEKLDTFEDCITDEVLLKGLSDDQEEVNAHGIEVYALYDKIVWLIENSDSSL